MKEKFSTWLLILGITFLFGSGRANAQPMVKLLEFEQVLLKSSGGTHSDLTPMGTCFEPDLNVSLSSQIRVHPYAVNNYLVRTTVSAQEWLANPGYEPTDPARSARGSQSRGKLTSDTLS